MAVDIRFYDIDGTELSLDKTTGGHDFGIVKKGSQYIYPVVVKNVGEDDAKNLSVSASALNSPEDISPSEFSAEQLAATWKTFSYLPTRGFASTINLPDIAAGTTMVGIKELVETFTNPMSSAWVNDTLSGHIFQWTGDGLSCIDGSESDLKIYARVDANGWGDNKEIDFTTTFATPANATMGSAFMMFCLRRNCLGDEKGYLVNLKRNTANGGSGLIDIRKGAGITVNGTNDFGKTLATSPIFLCPDYTPLRIKLFTNDDNLPEIKVWVGDIGDDDAPINFTIGGVTSSSWIDTENTYPFAGGISAIMGSGIGGTYVLKTAKLLAEDLEGKVWIRTIVGDGAVDGQIYNSALELSYDPPS
jgi:hypothetical protein